VDLGALSLVGCRRSVWSGAKLSEAGNFLDLRCPKNDKNCPPLSINCELLNKLVGHS